MPYTRSSYAEAELASELYEEKWHSLYEFEITEVVSVPPIPRVEDSPVSSGLCDLAAEYGGFPLPLAFATQWTTSLTLLQSICTTTDRTIATDVLPTIGRKMINQNSLSTVIQLLPTLRRLSAPYQGLYFSLPYSNSMTKQARQNFICICVAIGACLGVITIGPSGTLLFGLIGMGIAHTCYIGI